MVFGGPLHRKTFRYSTWKQAEEGHKVIVKQVKQKIKAK